MTIQSHVQLILYILSLKIYVVTIITVLMTSVKLVLMIYVY